MEAINFRKSKDEYQHHLIIDIDVNIVIEKVSAFFSVMILISLFVAFLGMISPFFYSKNFLEMSKNEIFWAIMVPVISTAYLYLMVRYRQKFRRIEITKTGERFFLPVIK